MKPSFRLRLINQLIPGIAFDLVVVDLLIRELNFLTTLTMSPEFERKVDTPEFFNWVTEHLREKLSYTESPNFYIGQHNRLFVSLVSMWSAAYKLQHSNFTKPGIKNMRRMFKKTLRKRTKLLLLLLRVFAPPEMKSVSNKIDDKLREIKLLLDNL